MGKIIEFSKPTKKVLSRLRNGHRVRIKRAIKGKGVRCIVSPGTYNIVSRTFGRGKGATIQLSPDEILANARAHSEGEIEGEGIYDDLKAYGTKAVGQAAHIGVDMAKDYLAPAMGAAASATGWESPPIV